MAIQPTELADLVKSVTTPLVENTDDLQVVAVEEGADAILIEIRAHEDDVGKIIGRQGRVIKAIRTVARAAGSRLGVGVNVELID